jgi:hypothetical protein
MLGSLLLNSFVLEFLCYTRVIRMAWIFLFYFYNGSRNILRRKILRRKILRRIIIRRKILRRKNLHSIFFSPGRKVLRRSILRPDNSSLGYFFARKILRRMILPRKVLRSDDSSPENSSPG